MTAEKVAGKVTVKKMPVSTGNITKATVQRTLGASSTQQDIDATVIAVRKLPWSSIVVPE